MHLHFRQYGAGPPLLLLHGLFGSLNNWHSVGRSLADTFSVFAVDLRNHGSSPHDPTMTYAAMSGDIEEFITAHGFTRVDLLGHSMGGKVAMQLCAASAGMVNRVIVVDIAPRRYDPGHDEILDALAAFRPGDYADREGADAGLAQFVSAPAVRQFLVANLVRNPSGGYRWRMHVPALLESYERLLEPVHLAVPFPRPALFIRGERSAYVTSTDEPLIRSFFPLAEIRTVPNAGHWVHADNPAGFRTIVREFLS